MITLKNHPRKIYLFLILVVFSVNLLGKSNEKAVDHSEFIGSSNSGQIDKDILNLYSSILEPNSPGNNGNTIADMLKGISYSGVPLVTTLVISDLKASKVTSGGTVTDNGGLDIIAQGLCWSTSSNPTIADSITSEGIGETSFTSHLVWLMGNTTYYLRAYATNIGGTGYGNEVSFKTAPFDNVCGTDTVILQTQNFDKGTIEWQESIDTINWVTIPESFGDTLKFHPTQTKYYRSIYTTSNSDPVYSAISFVQLPPIANAGSDKVVGGTITTLLGNKLAGTSGEWLVISGDSGLVAEPNNPYSQFSGKYNIDYKLKWTILNDCGQSADTIAIRFEEIIPKNNFIVVDNTDSLLSDSTEMASGIYRIKFSDPTITPKDSVILIGMRDSTSFLQKVISFTFQDSIYNFKTEQGSFEDLFKSGSIDFGDVINQDIMNGRIPLKSNSLDGNSNKYPTRKTIKDNKNRNGVVLIYSNFNKESNRLKSAKMAEDSSLNTLELSIPSIDLEVYNKSLKLTLEDINLSISPNWVGQLSFMPINVKVGLNNTLLKLNCKTKIEAFGRIEKDERSETIYRNSFYQWIIYAYGVPIIVDLNFSLKSKYNFSIEGAATLNAKVNYTNNFTCIFGLRKSDNEFSFDGNYTSTLISSSFNAGIHGELNIGPEVGFSFYKIFTVSPYISLQVKSEMDLKASLLTSNWQFKNKVGLFGYIGAKAVLEQNLFSKEKTLFDAKISIWGDKISKEYRWPNKLELISGDKQKGEAGKVLSKPISFRVLSSSGTGVPLVPVRFELEDGNGSISNSVLLTDFLGQVNLNWTIGLNIDNKLKAYVLDYENIDIENSPIYITAYSSGISNTCANSNLAISLKSSADYKYPYVTGGVGPYVYSINGTDFSSIVPEFSISTPGNFKVYVKDKNQCSMVRAFTINAPSPCENSDLTLDIVTLSKTVQITGNKGTPPYYYSIDNQTSFSTNNTFSNLTPGVHTAFLKDSKQCILNREIEIDILTIPAIKASYPLNGSKYIPVAGLVFSWLAGNYAPNQSYDISLKKGSGSYILLASNLNTISFSNPSPLDNSTSYTWKIDVKGSDGTVIDSAEFSFTTSSGLTTHPTLPLLLMPADGDATGLSVKLQWLAQPGDFKYDLYLDEQNATRLIASNLNTPEYSIKNLINGRTYFWKIKIKSIITGENATSLVWSFTPNSSLVAASEYWFDDDYGSRSFAGMPSFSGLQFNRLIPANNLNNGLHSFHIRFKDHNGKWSSIVSEFFHKMPITVGGSRNINTCEYWFDDAYASKFSAPITSGQTISVSNGIDVSSLTSGLHSYHVRYKDDAGQWSSVVSEFFHKMPVNINGSKRNITTCEYWFDDAYASKASAPITPGQTISVNSGIDVFLLSGGLHSYHVRYKDDAGQWSAVVSEFFHKMPVTSSGGTKNITTCEYWFDDGYASKVSMPVAPQQTVSLSSGIDVALLPNGLHSYHVRYKDDAGQWSSVVSEFFHKMPVNASANNYITTYRYWFDSDDAHMIKVTLPNPINPYFLIKNLNTCTLAQGDYTVHFQFRDSNRTWSSVLSEPITKGVILAPVVTPDGPTTICEGTTLHLTSTEADTYLWNTGATTQMISVTQPGDYYVSVNQESGCGLTSENTVVQVNPLPNAAEAITGPVSVYQKQAGVTYSTPEIENATSYTWTLPPDVTGTSTTNSITVDFGTTAASGTIKAAGHNDCGDGAESLLPVTVIPVADQDIPMIGGWNIFSANLIPFKQNMKDIFQPFIDAGKLVKVMDEAGRALEDFGVLGGWNNNIGDLGKTEGFKALVTEPITLSLEGSPIALPMDIPLTEGWNIISYPCLTSQDAMALVQPLIDAGVLWKIMDEAGNSLEDYGVLGGWTNNIGNFAPGKGFKINVTSPCTLTISGPGTKAAKITPEVLPSAHFANVFAGNGTDHFNIHLMNLESSGLKVGDEIGIFDGKYCVGSATIGPDQMIAGTIAIPASSADGISKSVNGFTAGHRVDLKLFRENHTWKLDQVILKGANSFEKNGSLFVNVRSKGLPAVLNSGEASQFRCYPNPFKDEITISIYNSKQTDLKVGIYNLLGQRIKDLFKGTSKGELILKWDGTSDSGGQVVSGVYLCKVNGEIKKVVFEGGE